jgi:hypothetical protein
MHKYFPPNGNGKQYEIKIDEGLVRNSVLHSHVDGRAWLTAGRDNKRHAATQNKYKPGVALLAGVWSNAEIGGSGS